MNTYLFESQDDAENFVANFNSIPQVRTRQILKARIVPSPELLEYSRPYLLHTLNVNHLTKRITAEKVTLVTKKEINELRAVRGANAPLVRAFDAFRAEKKTWDNPDKRYEVIHRGIKSGTPLEGDVVVSVTHGSESLGGTYISFFPDIRMRINASWEKTERVHDDGYGWEDGEPIDGIDEDDRGYRWIDASEWYLCKDCDVDTADIDEYFMIDGSLWNSCTTPEERDVSHWDTDDRRNSLMLCVGCIEKRLGRKLTSVDFPHNIPLNWSVVGSTTSSRLKDRMTDSGDAIWKQDTCEIVYFKAGITVETKFTKYSRMARAMADTA